MSEPANPYSAPAAANVAGESAARVGIGWQVLGWLVGVLGTLMAVGNATHFVIFGVRLTDEQFVLGLENDVMSVLGGAAWAAAGIFLACGKKRRAAQLILAGVLIGAANFTIYKMLERRFHNEYGRLRSSEGISSAARDRPYVQSLPGPGEASG